MERILIIGLQGSGKSTFANKLGKALNREVIHLDKIYYESGWKHTQTKEEWRQTIRDLVSDQKWIMDGQYNSTLDIRIPAADTIVFFNFSKFTCYYRIFKRIFSRTQPFDKAEGNFNKISWDLIKKIIYFPRQETLAKLLPFKNSKKIFIVKNSKEAEELLYKLTK
ncbi:MAG: AAA family ATPase [Candidatus Paceibacterota bacterium]|jgi:adenylate kinase family enzyme